MTLIENKINELISQAFKKANYNIEALGVKSSTHADFQCNDALPLAKKEGKNPREIAEQITSFLNESEIIESTEVAGPGFINITVNNDFLATTVEQIDQDEKHGFVKEDLVKNVFLDYGGPNVAKMLHVGHLRPAIIGQAINNIEKFVGNKTTSDVHLGDWGTPMGKIICELELEQPDLPYFDKNKTDNYPIESPVTIKELGELYVKGNIKSKEDETVAQKARLATVDLQKGRPGYLALWKHFITISIKDIKEQYDILNTSFDLWNGESDSQKTLDGGLIEKLEPYTEMSDGAKIISLKEFETNKPLPPIILIKSDGGYGYQSSDIADIYTRKNDYKADEIIYVTDQRQMLHFEQVFLACKKTKIVPEDYKFYHIMHGTINGADGKPLKTRDGGVFPLRSLIDMARKKALDIVPEGENDLAEQIALGAIKFNDMKNPIASDYNFDLDSALNFEGKTGPYMQYAVARINSILEKSNLPLPCGEVKTSEASFGCGLNENLKNKSISRTHEKILHCVQNDKISKYKIIIKTKEERALALQIDAFAKAVTKAYETKDPVHIADYAYELAKSFSSFYTACPILNNENQEEKLSRLHLAKCVKEILTTSLALLGIECPYKMLRR